MDDTLNGYLANFGVGLLSTIRAVGRHPAGRRFPFDRVGVMALVWTVAISALAVWLTRVMG